MLKAISCRLADFYFWTVAIALHLVIYSAPASANADFSLLLSLGYDASVAEMLIRNRPEIVEMIRAAAEGDAKTFKSKFDLTFPKEKRNKLDMAYMSQIKLDPRPVTVYRGFPFSPEQYDSKFSNFKHVESINEIHVTPSVEYALLYAKKLDFARVRQAANDPAPVLAPIVELQVPAFLYVERFGGEMPIGILFAPVISDSANFTRRSGTIDLRVNYHERYLTPEDIKWFRNSDLFRTRTQKKMRRCIGRMKAKSRAEHR